MAEGVVCDTCGKTRSPRLESCPYCRAARIAATGETLEAPDASQTKSSFFWNLLLAVAFLGGIGSVIPAFQGDGVFIMLDGASLLIGAAVAAVVVAGVAGVLVVGWKGGYAAVNEDMRREAAVAAPLPGVAGALAAGAFAHHAKHGYSRRDVRILHAFFLWPLAFGGLLLGGRALNSGLAGAEVDVTCQVFRVREAEVVPYEVTITCPLPNGSRASGRGFFQVDPRGTRHGRVRRGRLGIWLLSEESIANQ